MVGHGRQRSRKLTDGANGGRWRTAVLLGRARGKAEGFYMPATLQGGFARASLATVATAWARRLLATCVGRWPWREAVRTPASVGWPRGTGLGVGSASHPVGAQCPRHPASDRWVFRRLGVRTRGYGGMPTWRAWRDVVWLSALWPKTVSSDRLQNEISPNFQKKVHKSLNTKVAHQTTLYKIAKALGCFDH
jgi:hypothetical protein